MKIVTSLFLISIAVYSLPVAAMQQSPASDRSALTRTMTGQPQNRRKLSASDQELDEKLRNVLKPVPSGSFNSSSPDDSGESQSSEAASPRFQLALPENTQWLPVSLTIPNEEQAESPSPEPIEQPTRPAYPQERLMLGLTVEWLLTLPADRIVLTGIHPEYITAQTKQALIEHLQTVHRAVKHNLAVEDKSIMIHVDKLDEASLRFLNIRNVTNNDQQAPHANQGPLTDRNQQENKLIAFAQAVKRPALTGALGLVLGFIIAKKYYTNT